MARPNSGPYSDHAMRIVPVRRPERRGPSKALRAHWAMLESCRALAARIAAEEAALALELGRLYLKPAREAAANRTGPIEEWDPRKRKRGKR